MLSRIRASTLIGLAALAFWGAAIPYAVNTSFDGDRAACCGSAPHSSTRPRSRAPRCSRATATTASSSRRSRTDPLLLEAGDAGSCSTRLPIARGASACRSPPGCSPPGTDRWRSSCTRCCPGVSVRSSSGSLPGGWRTRALALVGGAAHLQRGFLSSFMGSMPDVAAMTLATAALWRSATGRRGAAAGASSPPRCCPRDLHHRGARHCGIGAAAAPLPPGGAHGRSAGAHDPRVARVRRRPVRRRLHGRARRKPRAPAHLAPREARPDLRHAGGLRDAGLALAFAGLLVLLPSVARWGVAETSYAGFAVMGLLLSRLNYVVIWWGYTRSLLPLAVLSVVVAARATGWRRWWFLAIALAWAG